MNDPNRNRLLRSEMQSDLSIVEIDCQAPVSSNACTILLGLEEMKNANRFPSTIQVFPPCCSPISN
jgi:hypothetical protein